MFNVGANVKLVRHDQYPQLVGLRGVVAISDDLPDGVRDEGSTEPLYKIHAASRTLYGVPESWLARN